MTAVIDGRMPYSAKAKLNEICEVIELPPFSALDARVASHPDMLIHILGGRLFVSADYYNEAKDVIDKIASCGGLELITTADRLCASYPLDIAFNLFEINNSIIGRLDFISKEIKEYAKSLNISLNNVNQGYAKCSTVALNNAVISADKGICDTARSLGAEALRISSDGVLLDGYGCGFIGGASGVFGDTVYFCGNITKHKNGLEIVDFCQSHGYSVISLSDEPLYDVGTIIFI